MDGSEDLVKYNVEMCEVLGERYVRAYSVPLPNVELPSIGNDIDGQGISVLTEDQPTSEEIMTSIKELRSNSSMGLMDYQHYY